MTDLGRLRAPWLQDAVLVRLFAALATSGRQSRVVGGAVRDAILDPSRQVQDFDIATQLLPEETIELLTGVGFRVLPTGLTHGTVTAIAADRHFEITTLRLDVETDGRHAIVDFTDDFVADAARRDFTFNALSCDPAGRLFDPFDGIADLRAGRVRFIGDADTRIREDYLRIMRFFRFQARLGSWPADPIAVVACSRNCDGLKTLAAERIWAELGRLLAEDNAAQVIDLMVETGIWEMILPFRPDARRLSRLHQLNLEVRPALALASLLTSSVPLSRSELDGIGERLKLSVADQRLLSLLLLTGRPDAMDEPESFGRWAYRQKLTIDERAAALILSWVEGSSAPNLLLPHLDVLAETSLPSLPITGQDLIERGIQPGPELGRLRAVVENAWVESNFVLDREACLHLLDSLLPGTA